MCVGGTGQWRDPLEPSFSLRAPRFGSHEAWGGSAGVWGAEPIASSCKWSRLFIPNAMTYERLGSELLYLPRGPCPRSARKRASYLVSFSWVMSSDLQLGHDAHRSTASYRSLLPQSLPRKGRDCPINPGDRLPYKPRALLPGHKLEHDQDFQGLNLPSLKSITSGPVDTNCHSQTIPLKIIIFNSSDTLGFKSPDSPAVCY